MAIVIDTGLFALWGDTRRHKLGNIHKAIGQQYWSAKCEVCLISNTYKAMRQAECSGPFINQLKGGAV